MRVRLLGDQAVFLELGEEHSLQLHDQILSLCSYLERSRLRGVLEWVPSYTGVTVIYDPLIISVAALASQLEEWVCLVKPGRVASPYRIVEIPVLYGGEWGPDLSHLALLHQLSESQVIQLHSAPLYRVYMMGFVPGFAYLGGLPPQLATPRLATPRSRIEAGSVGIAGSQTGIYPLATPGGWQIIGRTPLPLFQPEKQPPALLRLGDRIRFKPCGIEEFRELREGCLSGSFPIHVTWVKGSDAPDEGPN